MTAVLIAAAGVWHVRVLWRGGATREAVPTAIVWALALGAAVIWFFGLETRSPLAVLDRLFRGLSTILRTL